MNKTMMMSISQRCMQISSIRRSWSVCDEIEYQSCKATYKS